MADDKPTPTVVEAWSAVMADVQSVAKTGENKQQDYKFRGIDAVMNAVGPALRNHGVVVMPTVEDLQLSTYQTRSGATMHSAVMRMRYTVHGPRGDNFDGIVYGEAADSGDKAIAKAQSVAYRVFLLQSLTIPTDEPDPDAESHERVAGPESRNGSNAEQLNEFAGLWNQLSRKGKQTYERWRHGEGIPKIGDASWEQAEAAIAEVKRIRAEPEGSPAVDGPRGDEGAEAAGDTTQGEML